MPFPLDVPLNHFRCPSRQIENAEVEAMFLCESVISINAKYGVRAVEPEVIFQVNDCSAGPTGSIHSRIAFPVRNKQAEAEAEFFVVSWPSCGSREWTQTNRYHQRKIYGSPGTYAAEGHHQYLTI